MSQTIFYLNRVRTTDKNVNSEIRKGLKNFDQKAGLTFIRKLHKRILTTQD